MDRLLMMLPERFRQKRVLMIAAAALLVLVLQTASLIAAGKAEKTQAPVAESGESSGVTEMSSGGEAASENTAGEPTGEIVTKTVIVPVLVNNWNLLDKDFVPNGLVNVGADIEGRSDLQVNATVRQAYLLMQEDMRAQGVKPPMLISGYRSFAYQKQLYDKKVAELGPNQKVTAVPGTSEHQYGASVDVSTDGTCQNDFGETAAGKWIAENSYKYGFVVRYPVEKKELTGINFEPWHIRYVGVKHATKMYETGMCLEEYVEYLKTTYPYNYIIEVSPDQFPAPRWAGDTGEGDAPPSSSDVQ